MNQNLITAKSNLMHSAFDFLRRAINDLDTDLKFSVINFATAIELLLKARLMNEHWTLVVDRSSDADIDAFLEGKSRTVTPHEAIRRLEKVCHEPIGKDAASAFGTINQHRNRMIHFFHKATTPETQNTDKEQVIAEQCVCWFYLEQLFVRWTEQVAEFDQQIACLRGKMSQNAQFLAVKFNRLGLKINEAKAKGINFEKCVGCNYNAAKIETLSDKLVEHHCQVCGLLETRLTIPCPGCKVPMRVKCDYAEERSCPACKKQIANSELADILNTHYVKPKYHISISCAYCIRLGSVVPHGERYICSICLQMGKNIARCKWCNEIQMGGGDLEFSFESGCEFCDGRAGWHRYD
ncbi:MAG: hypothetical protein OXF29_03110 [Hyphomicrobiales bacterium]|nr:hypothetical protein [Hyphomicrobiales bacterium]